MQPLGVGTGGLSSGWLMWTPAFVLKSKVAKPPFTMAVCVTPCTAGQGSFKGIVLKSVPLGSGVTTEWPHFAGDLRLCSLQTKEKVIKAGSKALKTKEWGRPNPEGTTRAASWAREAGRLP